MDPVSTLVLAIGTLLVLDLAAPHLTGDPRGRRRGTGRRPGTRRWIGPR